MLVESAVLYVEVLQAKQASAPEAFRQLQQRSGVLGQIPPFSNKQWKDRWSARLQTLIDNFNTNLEWFVLSRYADLAQGIDPFFFPAEPSRTIFRHADYFGS